MLASEKVDQFYAFLKNQRYADHDPDTIIIISPNHYHPHSSSPQTIYNPSNIYFKNKKYTLTPFPQVACDEAIFYPFGESLTTKEHGIGEHLQRITKYFSAVKQVIPLILPTHRELPQVAYPLAKGEPTPQRGAVEQAGGLVNKEKIPPSPLYERRLIIASVDFSHYLPEATALANDEISIATLQS
jgi:predicted class III extradiol MEMO1 family dioxygenase